MQAHDYNEGMWPKSTGLSDGSDWTISFWVRGVTSPPAGQYYSDQFVVTSGRWGGLTVGSFNNPPNQYITYTDYNNDAHRDMNQTYFGNGGFHLYTLSMDWDGGGGGDVRLRLYKNGSAVGSYDQPRDPTPGTIYLGTELGLRQSGTYVDEFRISQNVRSSNWIRFQYCSMTQSCITIGGEESKEDKKAGSYVISNIDFDMRGNKIIGYDADELPVYKYAGSSHTTGYDGLVEIPNLEWDSYTFSLPVGSAYSISETTPAQPLNLLPASTTVITLGLSPTASHSALIIVKDINGEPIEDAEVHLYTTNPSYDETLFTNA